MKSRLPALDEEAEAEERQEGFEQDDDAFGELEAKNELGQRRKLCLELSGVFLKLGNELRARRGIYARKRTEEREELEREQCRQMSRALSGLKN